MITISIPHTSEIICEFLFHWVPNDASAHSPDWPCLLPLVNLSGLQFSSVQFSRSVVSDSLRPHEFKWLFYRNSLDK